MRSLPLESTHLKAHAALGDAGGAARVESYGDPGPRALAAREGAGLVDLSHRSRLAVVGPDRQSWLQGMVTNEVAKLGPGQGCAALALNNKGRILGDLRVHVRPAELWLGCEPQRGAPLSLHLSKFIIMEDCEVRDVSPELAELALVGPRCWEIARTVFDALRPLPDYASLDVRAQTLGAHPAVALGWPELGLPGVSFWVTPTFAEPLWEALRLGGAVPLGFDATELLRIEGGRPREGAELDEDTIPLEAGLEAEISMNKGCYLGQEIIARVSHRGHVNRKLVGFTLSGPPPALPSPLVSKDGEGEKRVGELRSAVISPRFGRTIALGYVRRELTDPGTALALSDGTSAIVAAVPFA